MAFIKGEKRAEIRFILKALNSDVKILFFTQEDACPTCSQQGQLLEELTSLSPRLTLTSYKFLEEGESAREYRIDKIPATAIVGERDYGIRFYGLTAGYEFSSLIQTLLMVSAGESGLSPQLETLVAAMDTPVEIQVMSTQTCPYCPQMVHVAHQFAMVNPRIRAAMVEISEFPHLSQRYNVTGVPKTIINEVYSFEGALQPEAVYLELLKAVNPERYKKLEEDIEKYQASGGMEPIEAKKEYEVVVIGGGPAGLSASVYAARKGLDVALIAEDLGGQLNYTAMINNYLGLPGISGAEMAELYRQHAEQQPIQALLGAKVFEVSKQEQIFKIATDGDKSYTARSVIYCAGMEYRRLGVPGEERLIGRGVGFCATCDAPLYYGKVVAVVGGGNSAFTALRDLMYHTSELHLIHRRDEYTADYELIRETLVSGTVKIHKPMEVREFLGTDRLTGVRLESPDGKDRYDLKVDGVFLEIGMKPNSDPLKSLIEMNEVGEVPSKGDGSTRVEGLFAAGDVTDHGDKQIAVAVGHGATAALTAYRYLLENKLTKSRIAPHETWQG
jgi:alkyl hydroperoxide reductase subunit F